MVGGEEVDVVGDRERQQQLDVAQRVAGSASRPRASAAAPRRAHTSGPAAMNAFSDGCAKSAGSLVGCRRRAQRGEVEHAVAQPRPHPRRRALGAEDAVGQEVGTEAAHAGAIMAADRASRSRRLKSRCQRMLAAARRGYAGRVRRTFSLTTAGLIAGALAACTAAGAQELGSASAAELRTVAKAHSTRGPLNPGRAATVLARMFRAGGDHRADRLPDASPDTRDVRDRRRPRRRELDGHRQGVAGSPRLPCELRDQLHLVASRECPGAIPDSIGRSS